MEIRLFPPHRILIVLCFLFSLGIFGQRQMDKNLAQNAPKLPDDKATKKQPREKQTTVVTAGTKRKGCEKNAKCDKTSNTHTVERVV
jgi:hypothetical protein